LSFKPPFNFNGSVLDYYFFARLLEIKKKY